MVILIFLVHVGVKSDNVNNYGKWVNADYDALMAQISTEANVETRWNLMLQAEEMAVNDYVNIPVFQKGTSALENPSVKGLVFRPVGVPYTFNYVSKEA